MNNPSQTGERGHSQLTREIETTNVPFGCIALWFLGQESVIIKGDGVTVLIDPYLSGNEARLFPPPIAPGQIDGADVCLITHDHEDHMDRQGLPHIIAGNPEMTIMAPGICREPLKGMGLPEERYRLAEPGSWMEIQDKLRILPVAGAHESLDLDEQGHPCYVGYILQLNGVTLYHAGDTVLFPELVDTVTRASVDLAMLPINGRDYFRNQRNIVGNMNYREAAEFAATAGFDTVIPLHYDLFKGNTENPGYFVDYLYSHFPEQKFHMMARAERFVYVSPRAFGV